ncbi:POZ domain-containing protein [Aspergillus indologenus CBS 114.80]|uniref:POZ domain-containing protein n=1 Tax=Aspergillus indologenus CBS 114.80 TaxID=1450541 RepID=A0A2V5I8E8_9EURO|nr:POZ domain-containing protein [Aspergillus indologenus CBS 114.80]
MASSDPDQKSVDVKHDVNTEKPGDLLASIKNYYSSSEFSDLTVHTLDQDFQVHRVVVCGQSEYFSRLFQGTWPEAKENEIHLKEDDPRAIEAMFQFMYGFEYDSSGSDQGRTSPMLLNVKVYQVADKYQVPKLKDRAREKFKAIVETCWQMDDFPVAIEEAYKRTTKEDRSLRDILVRTSQEHIGELEASEDFRLVLEGTAGFAADLVQIRVVTTPRLKFSEL